MPEKSRRRKSTRKSRNFLNRYFDKIFVINLYDKVKRWNKVQRQFKNRKIDTYEILDVYHSYKNKSSIVKCRVKYRAPAVYKTYIYKYKLLQKGIKWIIVDIDVHTYSKKRK